MGADQSSQVSQINQDVKNYRTSQLRRGKSVPEQNTDNVEVSRPGSCSPGLSVCSDADVPYIPYTVNRPIGDSPKLAKHLSRAKSLGSAGSLLASQTKKIALRKQSSRPTPHNIIVVKQAVKVDPNDDPEIQRLQTIPPFVPIMRSTVNQPSNRDPEILERLDPSALYRMCRKLQTHLYECASSVSERQNSILDQMKEIDGSISSVRGEYIDKCKSYKKSIDQLSKVSDLTSQVARCHLLLNKALESIERLNNQLPPDDRLEPFVWTTG